MQNESYNEYFLHKKYISDYEILILGSSRVSKTQSKQQRSIRTTQWPLRKTKRKKGSDIAAFLHYLDRTFLCFRFFTLISDFPLTVNKERCPTRWFAILFRTNVVLFCFATKAYDCRTTIRIFLRCGR